MPTNEDIQKTLNDFMNGFKPLRRSNPKTGQSEWYYMVPKNPSDEFTEYDYIDVPFPNTPNPLNSLNKMSKKIKDLYSTYQNGGLSAVGSKYATPSVQRALEEKNRLTPLSIPDYKKHAYVSCIGSQGGTLSAVQTLIGGLAKEADDLNNKINNKEQINRYKGRINIIKDSAKDMYHNIKGSYAGYNNREDGYCDRFLK